jgi:PBP1b-binding outer membrane lipoprotein LpoB
VSSPADDITVVGSIAGRCGDGYRPRLTHQIRAPRALVNLPFEEEPTMPTRFCSLAIVSLVAAASIGSGCKSRTYEDERPPVDQLTKGDRGLQSKDVVNASDQMAMELLSLPELSSSQHRWTIVFTGVKNQTTSARNNLDIFIQRLKSNVSRQGRDRVQIIANREAFHEVQSRELEQGERDDFKQGSGASNLPAGVQPDFALEAVAMDLANRKTNYYNFEFRLIDLKTREQVWSGMYEVKAAN